MAEQLDKPNSTTNALDENEKVRPAKNYKNILKKTLVVFAVLVTVLALGAQIINFQKQETGYLQLLKPSKIQATEIIRRYKENFRKPGTIFHQKTVQKLNDNQSITYEIWEDIDTPMFLNHVIDSSGNETWQWFDLDVYYDLDLTQKVLKKDIYVYNDNNPKGAKYGERVDLAEKFDQLLAEGKLQVEEGEIEGRAVYVIKDTRTDEDKFWDILTFDRDTFRLLKTERKDQGDQYTAQVVTYEIQESLPANEKQIDSLFRTPPVSLKGILVYSRLYDIGGTADDYTITGYPAGYQPRPETFIAGGLALQVPDNYEVTIDNYSDSDLEKITLIDSVKDLKITLTARFQSESQLSDPNYISPEKDYNRYANDCPNCPELKIIQKQNPGSPINAVTNDLNSVYMLVFLSATKKTSYGFQLSNTRNDQIQNKEEAVRELISLIENSHFETNKEITKRSSHTTEDSLLLPSVSPTDIPYPSVTKRPEEI